jgi:hypothetical protein
MRISIKLLAGLLTLLVLQTNFTFSQETKEEEQAPPIIVVTTAHANFDYKEGTYEDWLELEKEFFEKVTSKNEYLMHTNVLTHYYTEDNSEVKFIRVCKDWAAIEKAAERDNELAKEAWPDKEERSAKYKNQAKYFTNQHSDEIYQAIEGAKFMDEENVKEQHIYYVRVSHTAYPDDSEPGEIQKMFAEFNENVTHKNPLILAYYPYSHLYGADSRQFVEVFVLNSMADIELSADKAGELIEAHWPDEVKRKEFFKRYNLYLTGWHADYIYQNIPELMK